MNPTPSLSARRIHKPDSGKVELEPSATHLCMHAFIHSLIQGVAFQCPLCARHSGARETQWNPKHTGSVSSDLKA